MDDKASTEREYQLLQLAKSKMGSWCTVFNAVVAAQKGLVDRWGVDPDYIDREALRYYARESTIGLGRVIEARLNGFKTNIDFDNIVDASKETEARYLFGEYGIDINDPFFSLAWDENREEVRKRIQNRSRGLPENPLGEE